ncbi:hypothetical protein BLX87_23980, partial [Bacillus sp. VT-16-64]
ETILPLYTQNVRDVTAFDSGLMLLPGAIAMGIMSPIIGRIFDKIGGKGRLNMAYAVFCLKKKTIAIIRSACKKKHTTSEKKNKVFL